MDLHFKKKIWAQLILNLSKINLLIIGKTGFHITNGKKLQKERDSVRIIKTKIIILAAIILLDGFKFLLNGWRGDTLARHASFDWFESNIQHQWSIRLLIRLSPRKEENRVWFSDRPPNFHWTIAQRKSIRPISGRLRCRNSLVQPTFSWQSPKRLLICEPVWCLILAWPER